MSGFYAHSLSGQPEADWDPLDQHLCRTGDLAEAFAEVFAPGWGRIAGQLHDAGKYLARFQKRIRVNPEEHTAERVDHACVGAIIAMNFEAFALAWAIAGHHGGLRNAEIVKGRLESKRDHLGEARADGMPSTFEQLTVPLLPALLKSKLNAAMWTRFLFSALVDADFLDTEEFYKQVRRELPSDRIPVLLKRLEEHIGHLQRRAQPSPVNDLRRRVMQNCRDASPATPQVFTLTVPTGGGKTLASLLFALHHAIKNGLRRVIVVIPYTSIIDQTAKIYRDVLGAQNVLEHHTGVDPDIETPQNRLASENWDAPVVVTTNVQFFESLYANKTSRCRKLHRIAKSVVVIDEVQTVPVDLLTPIKNSLTQLTTVFGSSIVLCTATQPALDLSAREIIADVPSEFRAVEDRYRVFLPDSDKPVSWEALASGVAREHRALVIVHRRDDAAELAKLVGPECIHLSASMCGAHRLSVLRKIKDLPPEAACTVVSTQLVEAGVDLDFPVVYRAFAGADSLAQAAGRCNREGKSAAGHLRVFFAPTEPPRGILRTAQQEAKSLWKSQQLDIRHPDTFRRFFRGLYNKCETDKGVLAAEGEFQFDDVASRFKMIADEGVPVVCPYGKAGQLLTEIAAHGITRLRFRSLQPYIVTVYPGQITELERSGAAAPIAEGLRLFRLMPGYEHLYDDRLGLRWKSPIARDPATLIPAAESPNQGVD